MTELDRLAKELHDMISYGDATPETIEAAARLLIANGWTVTPPDEAEAIRADRDNAVKNAMERLPDAAWKDKTATEAVWLLSLAIRALTRADTAPCQHATEPDA